jgi:hypothetical protein
MRCAAATLAVLLATVGAAAGSEDVTWEEPAAEDEEEVVVEIDAVTSSHEAVPRPEPEPARRRDGRTFGCIQLRMVPDYDGHSILVLTFLRDGRCGQLPEEVTPPNTP